LTGQLLSLDDPTVAKANNLFKNAYNRYLYTLRIGMELHSEPEIALHLGIGRSTAHAVLDQLQRSGIIAWNRQQKTVLRDPQQEDYFPQSETNSLHDLIEQNFMQMILSRDAAPGMHINELELAREIGVATTSVREYLISFSRFGLIEKRPNGHWTLKGFTRQFALELADVREMFELHSALEFAKLPKEHMLWSQLEAIERDHDLLLEDFEERFQDFSPLDERFHLLIHRASNNRFIADFYDVISMVFHYHYQWNRITQKSRNRRAIEEHLAYIHALKTGNRETLEAACRAHLASARNTLLESARS
jgi:DNA-binding GntR family transcriptional regulator